MTWVVDHPGARRRWWSRSAPVSARTRPLGAGGVGVWTLLLGAWAGISVFVGPLFGYRPTTADAWQWTMQNWLLHLVPGAAAVMAGLVLIGTIPAKDAGRRSGIGLASLLAMAAGAWLVIGPAAYQWFEGASAFARAASAGAGFVDQLGANLGPGVLLAILGGMAFKAGIARPKVVEEETPAGAAGSAGAASPAG